MNFMNCLINEGATRNAKRVGVVWSGTGKWVAGIQGQKSVFGVAIKGFEGGANAFVPTVISSVLYKARTEVLSVVNLGLHPRKFIDAKRSDASLLRHEDALISSGLYVAKLDASVLLAKGDFKRQGLIFRIRRVKSRGRSGRKGGRKLTVTAPSAANAVA